MRQSTLFYVDILKANALERARNKVLQAFLKLSIGLVFLLYHSYTVSRKNVYEIRLDSMRILPQKLILFDIKHIIHRASNSYASKKNT